MAVVTKYGASYKDPSSVFLPNAAFSEGQIRAAISGTIAVANGDSIASKHYLGKVPSNAIILPHSTLYHGAITSLNDYDIGLELDGTVIDADLLADGIDLSSAGSKSVVAALTVAAGIGRQLWQIAGASVDPGAEYDIVGVMKAAATAAANLEAFIYYAKK